MEIGRGVDDFGPTHTGDTANFLGLRCPLERCSSARRIQHRAVLFGDTFSGLPPCGSPQFLLTQAVARRFASIRIGL